MSTFSDRYTGQPSPGATLPLPCNGVRYAARESALPAALLTRLHRAPLTTGQVIEFLGFTDSPVMRKLIARELISHGFDRQVRRVPEIFGAHAQVWIPGRERL